MARPIGTGAMHVTITIEPGRSASVHIGRGLLHALGYPERLSIRRNRPHEPNAVYLVPVSDPLGYAVVYSGGMPKIAPGRYLALEYGLTVGVHPAAVVNGVVRFEV